jgi:hypothetical protein
VQVPQQVPEVPDHCHREGGDDGPGAAEAGQVAARRVLQAATHADRKSTGGIRPFARRALVEAVHVRHRGLAPALQKAPAEQVPEGRPPGGHAVLHHLGRIPHPDGVILHRGDPQAKVGVLGQGAVADLPEVLAEPVD